MRLRRATATVALFITLLAGAVPCAAQTAAGRTFTVPVRARGSARAAFREALAALPGLQSVRLRSALADKGDRFVEGFFTATFRGRPVTGALLAARGGVAAGAFDTPDRAAQSVPVLLAQLGSGARASGAAAAAPLRTVSFGSGTIGLPESWAVANAYQGCVEAASTRDHGYLALGCSQAALAPPLLPGADPRTVLVLQSVDPVAALQRVLLSPPPVGLGVQTVHIAEVQPVAPAVASGRAAYVLFDYRVSGAPYRGLALVSVAPVDARTLMVYKSMFMLPSASFARLAPTLWQSWQSWGVNSGVLTGRLTAAAQSMRETGDIITGAYWARQHGNEQTSLGFSQYLRETAQLEDVQTGLRYNGSYFDASTLVQNNPVKYRIVPIGELAP
jgi:hypothetical protein